MRQLSEAIIPQCWQMTMPMTVAHWWWHCGSPPSRRVTVTVAEEVADYLNNRKRVGLCRECRDGQIVPGEPAAVNGCRLHPTRGPSRCAKGATCDHYGNCLDVAAKRDWQGWRTSA